MEIKKNFGNKIKFLRAERGWSQENLALNADLDRTYIPSIENGKRNVSLNVIHKLSIAFNLKVSELLKGID